VRAIAHEATTGVASGYADVASLRGVDRPGAPGGGGCEPVGTRIAGNGRRSALCLYAADDDTQEAQGTAQREAPAHHAAEQVGVRWGGGRMWVRGGVPPIPSFRS
jgi:hypothetical protein